MKKRKAIFLDRDGTINVEKNYLYKCEDWEWIPGAIEALKLLQEKGYLLFIVTNQAGIARGYYNSSDVIKLHKWVDAELKSSGVFVDSFYFCPHHPDYGNRTKCRCRKPDSGMILDAARSFNLNLEKSWIIGDSITDIEAGRKCGVQGILVKSGHIIKSTKGAVGVVENILDAVGLINGFEN